MELRELTEVKELDIVSERKADNTMVVTVPFCQADEKNQNGRTYPLALLKREVARIQDAVKRHSLIGSGDHPAGGFADIKTASHILQKVWLDSKGKGWAEMKIIPTERGKAIMTLISHDAELGVSSRGYGNVSPTGIVQNDYKLAGIDIVMHPAFKEGTFSKEDVYESVEFGEKEDTEDADTIAERETAMYELLQTSYGRALDGGFEGDFKFYCELHEKGMRQIMHLPEDDGKTAIQKLTEEQIKSRTFSYFQEAREAGFLGDYDAWKKAYPKLVEKASKPTKLSEQKKEPEKSFVGDARFYYNEAVKAGFKGTIEKFKEEHPECVAEDYEEKIAEEIKRKKQISETLDEEATRIFTELKKQNPDSSVTLESVKRLLEKEQEEKIDKRIRRKAIAIVSRDIGNAGGGVSEEKLQKMVQAEIEVLKKQRKEMRERNWQAYRKLLDE